MSSAAVDGPMRILVLCKRAPQKRDLLERPYGRFFFLPRALATRGHIVHMLLADYRGNHPITEERHGLYWHSQPLRPYPWKWMKTAKRLAVGLDPDWIIGLSDTWYGIAASSLARTTGARVMIDAYDNYEAYIPVAKPLHWLWRRALARAELRCAAGGPLLQQIAAGKHRGHDVVVPMAADPIFLPLNKAACRRQLGLDPSATLVGHIGSLHGSRDAAAMLGAMRYLRDRCPRCQFVFSGRGRNRMRLPANAVHLGYIADDLMPALVNAMDAVISANRTDAFGEHSYPVKLYESAACGVPFVTSSTQSTRWITGNDPRFLYEPGNAQDLADKLCNLLKKPETISAMAGGWEASAKILLDSLENLAARRAAD